MRHNFHKTQYAEMSEMFGKPASLIEIIADSQFEFLKDVMSEGEDEQVRLQELGLFQVKPGRRATIANRRQRIKKVHENTRQKKLSN